MLAADDDQCNAVEERPTFVVSNDDIHNLGELLMDGLMDGIHGWMDGWMVYMDGWMDV